MSTQKEILWIRPVKTIRRIERFEQNNIGGTWQGFSQTMSENFDYKFKEDDPMWFQCLQKIATDEDGPDFIEFSRIGATREEVVQYFFDAYSQMGVFYLSKEIVDASIFKTE